MYVYVYMYMYMYMLMFLSMYMSTQMYVYLYMGQGQEKRMTGAGPGLDEAGPRAVHGQWPSIQNHNNPNFPKSNHATIQDARDEQITNSKIQCSKFPKFRFLFA